MPKTQVKIAVAGASGYTGGELLRLLAGHPLVRVTMVTGDKSVGLPVSATFPNLTSCFPQHFEPLVPKRVAQQADVAFFALPHTKSMEPVSECVRAGVRVIDLGADFRLKDPATYQQWYQVPHSAPALLKKAVYGLPELHRSRIRKAQLVAVPGCYPTAAILQTAPLVSQQLIKPGTLIIDAKSGISGAGRSPDLPYHFPEAHESLKAYKIGTHRHTPEIEQELQAMSGGKKRTIVFTPHLVPINRGILSTAYAQLQTAVPLISLRGIYDKFFKGEPFIRLYKEPMEVSPSHVRGSNFCDIGIFLNERTGHVVSIAALDNLVKGAAGQAIQAMNLMLGFPEETGLQSPGLYP